MPLSTFATRSDLADKRVSTDEECAMMKERFEADEFDAQYPEFVSTDEECATMKESRFEADEFDEDWETF